MPAAFRLEIVWAVAFIFIARAQDSER